MITEDKYSLPLKLPPNFYAIIIPPQQIWSNSDTQSSSNPIWSKIGSEQNVFLSIVRCCFFVFFWSVVCREVVFLSRRLAHCNCSRRDSSTWCSISYLYPTVLHYLNNALRTAKLKIIIIKKTFEHRVFCLWRKIWSVSNFKQKNKKCRYDGGGGDGVFRLLLLFKQLLSTWSHNITFKKYISPVKAG